MYHCPAGPPEIISDVTQYGSKGERAMIQCMSISSPKPIFIWSRNGNAIDYATSGRFSAPEEGLPYGGKSNLQIINVQPEDFAVYNCTVTNGKGTATLMITLAETGTMFEYLYSTDDCFICKMVNSPLWSSVPLWLNGYGW